MVPWTQGRRLRQGILQGILLLLLLNFVRPTRRQSAPCFRLIFRHTVLSCSVFTVAIFPSHSINPHPRMYITRDPQHTINQSSEPSSTTFSNPYVCGVPITSPEIIIIIIIIITVAGWVGANAVAVSVNRSAGDVVLIGGSGGKRGSIGAWHRNCSKPSPRSLGTPVDHLAPAGRTARAASG